MAGMAEARGKPGPRRALTEAEILEAALALLDTGGAAAVSIRRIAAAVEVAPTAVYTYFPDKAAVERALIERVLAEVAGAEPGGDWRAQVEALAVDVRGRLIAHPGAVPLMLDHPLDGPHSLRIGEGLLGQLAAGGLDPASAARAAYLLKVYVLGAVALELPPEAERVARRRAALSEVPAHAFPHTAAAVGVLATVAGAEQFRWGLRRVLDGLAAEPELD